MKIRKPRKKDKKKILKQQYKWAFKIMLLAFVISLVFSFGSESLMADVNVGIGILIIFLFILVGIIFDMIGVAVTAAPASPFHAMSAKKIRGAKIAVKLKKNADRVSSFCNDVIGDICGIISGSAGAVITATIATTYNFNVLLVSLIVTATIASLTIGGKAFSKSISINNSVEIVTFFSKALSLFYCDGKK